MMHDTRERSLQFFIGSLELLHLSAYSLTRYRSQLQAGGNVDIHGQPETVDEHDARVGKSAKLSGSAGAQHNCHRHGRKIAR